MGEVGLELCSTSPLNHKILIQNIYLQHIQTSVYKSTTVCTTKNPITQTFGERATGKIDPTEQPSLNLNVAICLRGHVMLKLQPLCLQLHHLCHHPHTQPGMLSQR